MIVATPLEKQRDASKNHSQPPVTLLLTLPLDFMKFHTSGAAGLKSGQFNRK
jgi:hypothetical protein